MIGNFMISVLSWISNKTSRIVDKIELLHRVNGRFIILKDRILSGRTLYQLIILILAFVLIFYFIVLFSKLDSDFLFKGMTTYDHESKKGISVNPFFLMILYLVGVCFFSGFLVMVLTNGVRNRIDKYIAGDVRYRFYNHILILGYNDIADGVIDNVLSKMKTHEIVVVVENKVREIREKIKGKYGTNNKFYILHGNRINKKDLQSLYPNRAFEIFIIGENESNSDFKNLDCYNELIQIHDFSHWRSLIYLYLQEQTSITLINNQFYNRESLQVFQRLGDERLRIYNTDERWARRILVDSNNTWPEMNLNMRDDSRITMDSNLFVHIVIFGMTNTGEIVATTAAKTCHHPNFITKGIRTKITVIDDNFTKNRGMFHGRYSDFMKMCHYTIKRIRNNKCETLYNHCPARYLDYLDIEWEFIESATDEFLLQKELNQFVSKSSLLSVVICGQDEKQNISIALGLPNIYIDESIPIWLYTRSQTSLRTYLENTRYDNIMPWGMLNNLPTQELWEEVAAKDLNEFINKHYTNDEKVEKNKTWKFLPLENKYSAIIHASAIPVFVGSMRNWSVDVQDFELSDEEIEVFSQLEYTRWTVCMLLRGYRLYDKKSKHKYFSSGNNNKEIKYTLDKHFYNRYICKYDKVEDKERIENYNKALVKYYKTIIYKHLKNEDNS